jgi:hypothetical protein
MIWHNGLRKAKNKGVLGIEAADEKENAPRRGYVQSDHKIVFPAVRECVYNTILRMLPGGEVE